MEYFPFVRRENNMVLFVFLLVINPAILCFVLQSQKLSYKQQRRNPNFQSCLMRNWLAENWQYISSWSLFIDCWLLDHRLYYGSFLNGFDVESQRLASFADLKFSRVELATTPTWHVYGTEWSNNCLYQNNHEKLLKLNHNGQWHGAYIR